MLFPYFHKSNKISILDEYFRKLATESNSIINEKNLRYISTIAKNSAGQDK